MRSKAFLFIACMLCAAVSVAQTVVNDVGLRLSLSIEKKLNDRFAAEVKVLTRQVENFTLLNRVYIRAGLSAKLNKNFKTEARFYYMPTRKGYKAMNDNFRYALSVTYKAKLTRRLTFYDRITYQTTTNYLVDSPETDEKTSGVIRDRFTLAFKQNRRGEPYISEELLFQVAGKKERYFGRNRVYLGYKYQLTDKLKLNAYFIWERGFNDNDGPQEQNFYYGFNLGYSF